MTNSMNDRYDVFLSHRNEDKPWVVELANRLVDKAGLSPFLDEWHLIPGAPWQEEIEDALNQSRTCAVFISHKDLGPWQNEEMRAALDRRARRNDFRVIPVLLPGADPESAISMPVSLGRMTWVDFRRGLDDQHAFSRLVAGINGEQPGRNMMALGSGRTVSTLRQGAIQKRQARAKGSIEFREKASMDAGNSPSRYSPQQDNSNSLSPPFIELSSRILFRVVDIISHTFDEITKRLIYYWLHITETPEGFNRVVKAILWKVIAFVAAVLVCFLLIYWR